MNLNQTLENLRVSYQKHTLDIHDCDADPVKQFNRWLEEAVKSECDEPNALILSTIKQNRPHARTVLLKGLHEGKFVFYTNYLSAKGDEINENPNVCLTFLWLPLHRQVRIEGVAKKVADEISDDYFQKRPRDNQLGAMASPQSKRVQSRDELERMFKETELKFSHEQDLKRPLHWGGYSVEANYFEFWQGRQSRMHDRIIYEKNNHSWEKSRLAP
jgi:pyridoxamine 5'-phosphate oxidase